jgi:hypothetical protein
VDRNATTESESTGAGVYTVGPLLPGKYNLTVEKTGFKKYVKEGILLATADRLGLNVRLELGAVAESVTVTGEASLLQTETASRSSLIQNRAIEDIPTNGRNLYQLQFTLPGVVKTSRYWGSMELYAFGNVNGVMISGGRQQEYETCRRPGQHQRRPRSRVGTLTELDPGVHCPDEHVRCIFRTRRRRSDQRDFEGGNEFLPRAIVRISEERQAACERLVQQHISGICG